MSYLYGAVGALILLLGGLLLWRGGQLDRARAQVTELHGQITQAASANAAQKASLEQFSQANARFANAARLQQSEYRGLLAEHVRLRVKWQEAEAARQVRENRDKASAACRAVLDLDLSKACPNIAEAIRERAR